ncbi:DNA ligase 4 [Gryllus bimaculatus]|nr:DNA ligase 4 [Gryllus bimaculatus]
MKSSNYKRPKIIMTTNTVASKIPFSDLCKLCEKVSCAKKPHKQEILKKYIKYFRDYAEKFASESPQVDTSFYPVMRLLLPQLDRERGPYGVKEHTLAVIYIRILCLPKGEIDAEKLLNYRAPKSSGSQAGDFADVAYWILKRKCPDKGNLTVENVNNYLDNIALKNASNDRRGMELELIQMLKDMSAFDQKWLIRILLKDMKLGLGQTSIFNAFHLDAKDLYDVSNSLEKICNMLKDPNHRLHELEVEIFSPFRPMLAEQCSIQKVEECFKRHSLFYVETKHDGERFQLHYKNNTFKYFSRNGFEYTEVYGSSSYKGGLSPQLAKCISKNVTSCIIDGEMMVWDKRKKFFRTKGENIEVKALKESSGLKPCFCVFDVLMYNDQVVTNKPLEDRYALLKEIFIPEEGVVMLTERTKVTSKEEVISHINQAIDSKLEGIMMKQPMSVYKPNNRKAGWYKIKPEYTEGLMDHLDTIIMGGYYGEGRRSGFISHFLVGLAVPNTEGDPVEFHSLTRVGSGYTMTKLEELLSKMDPHWNRVVPGVRPSGLEWAREKPDVWIEPQKSYILQIKATEIVDSRQNAFKTNYTLRFPRNAEGKLYSRHVTVDGLEESSPKKKRRISPTLQVAQQFTAADLTEVTKKSELFNNKEFCVISGTEDLTKQEIEKQIHSCGGNLVQNPGSSTFCVLANELNIRVSNIVKCGRYNVAKISWLLKCLDVGQLLPWSPSDLLGTTAELERDLKTKFDSFGDNYTNPATIESLKYSLDSVEKQGDMKVLGPKEMADMDIEIFGDTSPLSFFRLCSAYVDKYNEVNDPSSDIDMKLEVVALDFVFYGGCVQEIISEETTHVIIHSKNMNHLEELQMINHQREKKFHIVTEKWVEECVKKTCRINEREDIFSS